MVNPQKKWWFVNQPIENGLGGGFEWHVLFSPLYSWGRFSPILTFAYFSDGLVKPPTSGGQGLPGLKWHPLSALEPDDRSSPRRLGLIKHGAQWSEVLNVGGTKLPPGYVGWRYVLMYKKKKLQPTICFLKMPSLQDVCWWFGGFIMTFGLKVGSCPFKMTWSHLGWK